MSLAVLLVNPLGQGPDVTELILAPDSRFRRSGTTKSLASSREERHSRRLDTEVVEDGLVSGHPSRRTKQNDVGISERRDRVVRPRGARERPANAYKAADSAEAKICRRFVWKKISRPRKRARPPRGSAQANISEVGRPPFDHDVSGAVSEYVSPCCRDSGILLYRKLHSYLAHEVRRDRVKSRTVNHRPVHERLVDADADAVLNHRHHKRRPGTWTGIKPMVKDERRTHKT